MLGGVVKLLQWEIWGMRIDNLNAEDLSNIVSHNKRVGVGSYGIVCEYDEDTLFKFCYKPFIDCFQCRDGVIDLSAIGDISQEINQRKEIDYIICRGEESARVRDVKDLIGKGKWLTRTSMPKGLVYVDGYCVGYLLKYHKNMVNLYDYLSNHSISEVMLGRIAGDLSLAVQELSDNAIYHDDFTLRNVMYDPQSGRTEIIDFEDAVRSYDEKNSAAEKSFKRSLDKVIQYLMSKVDSISM